MLFIFKAGFPFYLFWFCFFFLLSEFLVNLGVSYWVKNLNPEQLLLQAIVITDIRWEHLERHQTCTPVHLWISGYIQCFHFDNKSKMGVKCIYFLLKTFLTCLLSSCWALMGRQFFLNVKNLQIPILFSFITIGGV